MKLFKAKKLLAVIPVLLSMGLQNAVAATPAVMAKVKESGKEFHKITKNDKNVILLPDSVYADDTRNFVFSEVTDKTGFAAEVLYYISKDELVAKSSKADKSNIDTSMNAVSKIVRSVSKMKGMQYYSNSKKRYETLYSESYRVDNPENCNPVADDLADSSDGKQIYIFQNEHTFGKAVYRVRYRENSKVISMKLNNVSNMYYGIIKAVDVDKCRIVVNIVDDGDGYFIYLGMRVDCSLPGFLEGKMTQSFQARLDALYNWITLQF